MNRAQSKTPPAGGGAVRAGLAGSGLAWRACFSSTADVDEVVGDHAEPDPALHAGIAFVAAAVEPVSPFDHADAPLASGPPFLAVAEPALLLLALALGALGGAIGNADAFDALAFAAPHSWRSRTRVGRDQTRRASELASWVSMAGISRSESLGRRS